MSALREIGEFGLIDRLRRLIPSAPAVLEGIGDDCAVVRTGDRLLLLSCDLFIEDVHFRRRTAQPADIGWKAATSSLSDIAAMGGAPLFCLVGLACPDDCDVALVEGIYAGLTDAAGEAGAVIVGGDTTRSARGIVLDVTVVGEVIHGRYLARRGAQAGDLLVVTGSTGLSAAGLWALEHGHSAPALAQAHFRPHARIAEGQWLAACEAVQAMLDVSDGVAQDAGHLAEAMSLGVDIRLEQVPIDPELDRFCARHKLDPHAFTLAGGEDYELLFALRTDDPERCLDEFQRQFPVPPHIIGRFTGEWQGVRADGQPVVRGGFDHFRRGEPEDPPA